MKRSIYFLLSIAIIVVLAGCASNPPQKATNAPSQAGNGTSVSAAGASASGTGATETSVRPDVRSTVRTVPPGPASPVVWSVPIKQRAVFITIDDGWYPSQEVLDLMKQYHLPVTAFLIQEAAAEHVSYWREFVNLGGSIEDHTYSHPFLTKVSEGEDLAQIASPIQYFKQLGANPDELRPPYGDSDLLVQKMAAKAGIKYVVMWDAIMDGGKLTTYNGKALVPGEIVLLHWLPGLGANLKSLMGILKEDNLGVASLSDALAGKPVAVVFPDLSQPSTSGSVYGSVYTTVYSR